MWASKYTFMEVLMTNLFLDLHPSNYTKQQVNMPKIWNGKSPKIWDAQSPSNLVHQSENIVIYPTRSHSVAKTTKKREKLKITHDSKAKSQDVDKFLCTVKLGHRGMRKIKEDLRAWELFWKVHFCKEERFVSNFDWHYIEKKVSEMLKIKLVCIERKAAVECGEHHQHGPEPRWRSLAAG